MLLTWIFSFGAPRHRPLRMCVCACVRVCDVVCACVYVWGDEVCACVCISVCVYVCVGGSVCVCGGECMCVHVAWVWGCSSAPDGLRWTPICLAGEH